MKSEAFDFSGKLVTFYGVAGSGARERMIHTACYGDGKIVHICDSEERNTTEYNYLRHLKPEEAIKRVTTYSFPRNVFDKRTLIEYLDSLEMDKNTTLVIDGVERICEGHLAGVLYYLKAFSERTGVATLTTIQAPSDGRLIIETIIPHRNVRVDRV